MEEELATTNTSKRGYEFLTKSSPAGRRFCLELGADSSPQNLKSRCESIGAFSFCRTREESKRAKYVFVKNISSEARIIFLDKNHERARSRVLIILGAKRTKIIRTGDRFLSNSSQNNITNNLVTRDRLSGPQKQSQY